MFNIVIASKWFAVKYVSSCWNTDTRKNYPMRCVTHRQAGSGPVIHMIFDVGHYQVLWTCAWMWRVLYQLYVMTWNCATSHETLESQRAEALSQFWFTCASMESGRARGMVPLVKYIPPIELWIPGEPRLILLVKFGQNIRLRITGAPGLTTLANNLLHIKRWIVGGSEPSCLQYDSDK